jgi:hypothetical protein
LGFWVKATQDGVIHVNAQHIAPLEITNVEVRSRDFY